MSNQRHRTTISQRQSWGRCCTARVRPILSFSLNSPRLAALHGSVHRAHQHGTQQQFGRGRELEYSHVQCSKSAVSNTSVISKSSTFVALYPSSNNSSKFLGRDRSNFSLMALTINVVISLERDSNSYTISPGISS